MEKSNSNSSFDCEEEKFDKNLKISDLNQNEKNKVFYSIYDSGSIEGEEKDNKNQNDINIKEDIFKKRSPTIIEKDLIESVQKMENVTKENLELAEKIKFKNNTDRIIETDEFGFFKKDSNGCDNNDNNKMKKESNKLTKEQILTINARTEKWQNMLSNYEKYQTTKRAKLKSRTRKGVPDSLRSIVWQLFAESDKLKEKNLFENLNKQELDKDIETVIIKDLDRTFPSCQLFKEKYGVGQRKLYRVLANYSKYNKVLGYVQGMGYLAAIFLLYMDEESSFYMLHSLVKNYGFEGLYKEGFPDLKKNFMFY